MAHLITTLLREPPLDADHEARLARAARAGDDRAREELVRASLRLVALRVRAMGFGPQDADDALQEGVLALVAAVRRFDPDRGARLATFAWPRIGGALLRFRLAEQRADDPALPDVEVASGPVDDGPGGRLDDAAGPLVAGLPGDEAAALRLRLGLAPYDGERSWEEVGRHLGISPATARRRSARGVSRLRRGLATVGDRAPRGEPIPHSSIGRAFDC